MNVLGIALRKPRSGELTAAVVMGSGLWVAAVGLLHLSHIDVGRADAGALLLVVVWACVAARIGIRVGAGARHLAVNLLVSAGLLTVYQGALAFMA